VSQFVPPDRPHQGMSQEVLEIQLIVCTQAVRVIEQSLDDISNMLERCRSRGETTGQEYAQLLFNHISSIFESTLADCQALEREIDIRKQPRNN